MMVSPWATGLTEGLGIFVEYPCIALRIYSCSSPHGRKYFFPEENVAGWHISSGDVSQVLSVRYHGENHKASQKLEPQLYCIDRYCPSVVREGFTLKCFTVFSLPHVHACAWGGEA